MQPQVYEDEYGGYKLHKTKDGSLIREHLYSLRADEKFWENKTKRTCKVKGCNETKIYLGTIGYCHEHIGFRRKNAR